VSANRGVCAHCGKLRFLSRREARTAAKRAHPSAHLNAYWCNGYWHYGSLPPAVLAGRLSRAAIGRRR
jgi:hypothetical protein